VGLPSAAQFAPGCAELRDCKDCYAHNRSVTGKITPPSSGVERMSFSAQVRQRGAVSVVDLSGRLTSFETSALRDTISGLLKRGQNNIILSMGGLSYLDSSGIGELARIYVTVVKRNGVLKVIGLRAKIEEILKITHLHQIFQEFSDEEAALQSFPESVKKGSQDVG
jgi:anti-sigma B factor antagonist